MGALTAGLLESLSAWTGIRSLPAPLHLFSLLVRASAVGPETVSKVRNDRKLSHDLAAGIKR